MTLELLVGIADQADVDELGPVGLLSSLAAHVDNAVAERTPLLADYRDAAVFEGLEVAIASGNELASDAGEQATVVHANARLDGLDNRHNARIIARMGDHDIQIGDVVVLLLQIRDGRLFVDGQNSILEGILGPKADILHMYIANG